MKNRSLNLTFLIFLTVPAFATTSNPKRFRSEGQTCTTFLNQALGSRAENPMVQSSEILNSARQQILVAIPDQFLDIKADISTNLAKAVSKATQDPEVYEKAAQALRKRLKNNNAEVELPSFWPEVVFYFSLSAENTIQRTAILNTAKTLEAKHRNVSMDLENLDIPVALSRVQKELDAYIRIAAKNTSAMRILVHLLALENISPMTTDQIQKKVALISLVDTNENGQSVVYDRISSHLSIAISADPINMADQILAAFHVNLNGSEIESQLEIMIRQINRDYGIQILPIGRSPDINSKTKHMTAENYAAVGGLWHHKDALKKLATAGVRKLYISPSDSWLKTNGIEDGKLSLTFGEAFRIETVLKQLP